MPNLPAVINLADLDGTNGFRLDGIDRSDSSGTSVSSAGEVNGDGFDDVIIGHLVVTQMEMSPQARVMLCLAQRAASSPACP